MALPIWQRTITDNQGNVIPGAEVLVVVEATGLPADIFSNRSGTTPLTNPFFTGTDGFAQFYADPGEYRIEATGPTGSIVWRWNVLTGDAALRTVGTAAGEVPTNGDLGTMSTQDADDVNITGGDIADTDVTGGTVNPTTLQQGGSQAYVRSNILGTVSQSGGVPTGAIIQRGSNAGGEFVKYADGTQICTIITGLISGTGGLRVITYTFPASFSALPSVSLTWRIDANLYYDVTFQALSTSGVQTLVSPPSGHNGSIHIIAIGRWF